MAEDQSTGEEKFKPEDLNKRIANMLPQDFATRFRKTLGELIDEIHGVSGDNGKGRPPPDRVLALMADTRSLTEGISRGVITISQPRIAANLVEVATILGECGHHSLVASFIEMLEQVSVNGLAAENCVLNRNRSGPTRR